MRPVILVLEDEAPVRAALLRDLAPFADHVRLEEAGDAGDAEQVLGELGDDPLAVVLADHRLPGRSGVTFLVELRAHPTHGRCRSVLVTGQADHADTIRAVNEAGLDHYIDKPWTPEDLARVVRHQLTRYVLDEGLDPLPLLPVLDHAAVFPHLRHRGDS